MKNTLFFVCFFVISALSSTAVAYAAPATINADSTTAKLGGSTTPAQIYYGTSMSPEKQQITINPYKKHDGKVVSTYGKLFIVGTKGAYRHSEASAKILNGRLFVRVKTWTTGDASQVTGTFNDSGYIEKTDVVLPTARALFVLNGDTPMLTNYILKSLKAGGSDMTPVSQSFKFN